MIYHSIVKLNLRGFSEKIIVQNIEIIIFFISFMNEWLKAMNSYYIFLFPNDIEINSSTSQSHRENTKWKMIRWKIRYFWRIIFYMRDSMEFSVTLWKYISNRKIEITLVTITIIIYDNQDPSTVVLLHFRLLDCWYKYLFQQLNM